MERVALLVEETGDRIDCLLNPSSVVVRRTAGLLVRSVAEGRLTRLGRDDDPLVATGGGVTEFEIDLLFDVQLAGRVSRQRDVRALTGRLWALAENRTDAAGGCSPPRVRFVWGRTWNLPAVVAEVAERLEHFDVDGTPRRSWVRLRLLRASDRDAREAAPRVMRMSALARLIEAALELARVDIRVHRVPVASATAEGSVTLAEGQRLDLIAARHYGHPGLWRVLAAFNDIDDPFRLPPGRIIRIPVIPWLGGAE